MCSAQVSRHADAAVAYAALQAYVINFRTLQQINLKTQYSRPVTRMPPMQQVNATTQYTRPVKRAALQSQASPSATPALPAVQRPDAAVASAPPTTSQQPSAPLHAGNAGTSAAASAKEAARAARRAAAATKAAAMELAYRQSLLAGPLVLKVEGEKKDVARAVKRLHREFAARCQVVERQTPPDLRLLRKALRGQMAAEATRRGLILRLVQNAGSASSSRASWHITCKGKADGLLSRGRVGERVCRSASCCFFRG